MFEIEINAVFSAAHALVIKGEREALHGHDWHVTAVVGAAGLDADGLLVDFHWLEGELREIIRPFQNQNLNECEPFRSGVNPSAERVAEHIGRVLSARLQTRGPGGSKDQGTPAVRLLSLRVTEAVGCAAVYRP